MRRVILALSLVSVVALLGAAAPSAINAMKAPSASAAFSFTLKGGVPGGITLTEGFDPITFVFTATNHGSAATEAFLNLTKVTGATTTAATAPQGCVDARGFEFGPDGTFCEPPAAKPGQSIGMIVQLTTASGSTSVAVSVCVVNPQSGASRPCQTVSVQSAG